MDTVECDVQQKEVHSPVAQMKSIKFSFMTSDEIEKFASVNIMDVSDLGSSKLGFPNTSTLCGTCGSLSIEKCDGHSGMVKLPRQIYNPYFLSEIVTILNQVCVGCKSIKNNLQMKKCRTVHSMNDLQFLKVYKLLRKTMPSPTKFKKCVKRLSERELKYGCSNCQAQSRIDSWYPRLKFKIMKDEPCGKSFSIVVKVNEKLPNKYKGRDPSDVIADDYWDFVPESKLGLKLPDRTKMFLSPSQIFMTSNRHVAFYLLKELDKHFIEKYVPRRDLLFLSHLPITPNSHRVSEVTLPHGNGPQLIFDKRTTAYKSLLNSNRKISDLQLQSYSCCPEICRIVSNHSFNCLSSSNLQTNRSMKTKFDSSISGSKWIKNAVVGKRSDHTFNMVVVGDPKIRLGEIGVPYDVCGRLNIPEYVAFFNIEELKRKYPEHFRKNNGIDSSHPVAPRVGDIFKRPLEDGDTILVYRPPSVHQHSLIALKVKIIPVNSVVALNPLCCSPLKGDFDGDILFGAVPQSLHCRVELDQLVSLDNQLWNGQDGRSILSLSHDSLTAAHLLMDTDVFVDMFQMQQLLMSCPQKTVFPAILKSPSSNLPLWTGRQLFSSLLPVNLDYDLESTVKISSGEVIFSSTESFWLKNTPDGFFSALLKCCGRKALDTLYALQEVLCEWISSRGFSVSLKDAYICSDKYNRKKMMIQVANAIELAKYDFHIRSFMLDPKMIYLYNNCLEYHEFSCMNCEKQILESTKLNPTYKKILPIDAFREVFLDIQNIINHFAHKEISFLQMIHSGSKGTLAKLSQQAVCLGVQIPAISWQFDNSKTFEGKNNYSIIESSFLDGLNPYECLLHAACARSNFFSDNAQLPWALSRKLMVHMRDVYEAYDGTVRNLYGQQIVQFLNEDPKKTCLLSKDSLEFLDNPCGYPQSGKPVGIIASCAVSEAAYGGLDQPTTTGKSSLLMSLKNVFSNCLKKSQGKSVHLALSKKLKRWEYGFEYGALEVQRLLQRVFLSDITETVLIIYARKKVPESVSPWIIHFHLSKKEMEQRKVTLQHIIDILERKCNLAEYTMNNVSCKMNFSYRTPQLNDDKAGCIDSICFTVTVESSEFGNQLDDIRDILVPSLLQTIIKGFKECEKVDILWDDGPNSRSCKDTSGELFIKVSFSKHFSRRFWNKIQTACIPIMKLIDWDRSQPDNVCDFYNYYGILSAWSYFVKSLKDTTTNLGRNISQHHLLLVANCLTSSGQFSGLCSRGIRLQRKHFNISSPFMQGCSFRPTEIFKNAAKHEETDHLLGTIDAMAWGMEAPVGTGGSFDILYSAKLDNFDKQENIYEALVGHSIHYKGGTSSRRNTYQSGKWESWASAENKKTGKLNGKHFPRANRNQTKIEASGNGFSENENALKVMYHQLQDILHGNPIDSSLDRENTSYVMDALLFHPKCEAKIGVGAKEIKIGYHPLFPKSRCFFLVRTDGTSEDFSFKKCVIGANAKCSLETGASLN